ncbi:hypothetical protein J2129_000529 [Methanofollis sp. W23]|uniref:DUF6345 domain-containing protein n=1 Tax=Methanofollis sp. W23 TaxID=2817849 RepID=UPI001AE808B0|nr:DUF6345 domain-containing protein [Methanofollis sp. W23]MBP2145075.1 hypothetical protein [Methanofollis sp. W23]
MKTQQNLILKACIVLLCTTTMVSCTSAVTLEELSGTIKGTGDDGGAPEVGVEWVTSGGLVNSDDSAEGFYNTLGNAGWTRKFNKGDASTSESHFEYFNGGDRNYIDGVDIAFFQGHGSDQHINLGTYGKDVFFRSEIEWGDYDLEWIALHSCSGTKEPGNFKGSHYGLNGVHFICGFETTSYNYAEDGPSFAERLLDSENVPIAWYHAMDETHPSGSRVQMVADDNSVWDDRIWGQGSVASDPPVDEHWCAWSYGLH